MTIEPAAEERPDGSSANASLPTTSKTALTAGGLTARLAPVPSTALHSAGSAVFAEIAVRNGSERTARDAALVLEPNGVAVRGLIAAPKPATRKRAKRVCRRWVRVWDRRQQRTRRRCTRYVTVKQRPPVATAPVLEAAADGRHIATLPALAPGKTEKLLVELRLGQAGARAVGHTDQTNRLKVTLRSPEGEAGPASDSTVLTWRVANCAGAFHAALIKIRDGRGQGIEAALKAAQSADRSRPGRWLFRPKTQRTVVRRVCRRWSRSRDFWSGAARRHCVRYGTVRKTVSRAANLPKEERDIYRFASAFVSTRGTDRLMRKDRDGGWVTRKVGLDLRRYLNQEVHPALCTGAVQFTDYYRGKLGGVGERAEQVFDFAQRSQALAASKVANVRAALKSDPGGHPGWGAAPLALTGPEAGRSLHEFVIELAALAGDADLRGRVADSADAFAALRLMDQALRRGSLGLAKETLGAFRHALGAIEAADYIAAIERKYRLLQHAVDGSISAVRKAHGTHCRCRG